MQLKPYQTQDYAYLLKGADREIDMAHHIDIIPINSTEHPFSIKSITLHSDDSISISFGGFHENFMSIPDFDYTRTFQIGDSFVFYCMPTESGYPSLGIYKYLGIHEINDNPPSFIFYHGDGTSQNRFECIYPDVIEQSVNLFDIQITSEFKQRFGLPHESKLPTGIGDSWGTGERENICKILVEQISEEKLQKDLDSGRTYTIIVLEQKKINDIPFLLELLDKNLKGQFNEHDVTTSRTVDYDSQQEFLTTFLKEFEDKKPEDGPALYDYQEKYFQIGLQVCEPES